jgi:hypothetical protein
MALPQTVRVKLSSEAAGAIAITPVVVQELPIRELVEHLLAVAGKDEARIAEILRRGTVTSGASRFRWVGWQVEAEALRALLATFPDDDPALTFAAERCTRAILRGGLRSIEIPREAAARKGLLQRRTFWDELMAAIAAGPTEYRGYSFRDRADRFRREFTPGEVAQLRAARSAVKFSTLRDQIAAVVFTAAELYVER